MKNAPEEGNAKGKQGGKAEKPTVKFLIIRKGTERRTRAYRVILPNHLRILSYDVRTVIVV